MLIHETEAGAAKPCTTLHMDLTKEINFMQQGLSEPALTRDGTFKRWEFIPLKLTCGRTQQAEKDSPGMTAILPLIAMGPGDTAACTTVSWSQHVCARAGAFIVTAAAPEIMRS